MSIKKQGQYYYVSYQNLVIHEATSFSEALELLQTLDL